MFNNFTETELAHEKWKDIFGYDGAYQVSDLGRVRSLKFGKTRVLRPGTNMNGYLYVILNKDGKSKNFRIHRIVAQAFIPNDDSSKTIINHINEIKSDNRVSNLEWCDYRYNLTYNDLHHRRTVNRNTPQHYNCKRSKIKELYDPNLSIQKNLEIFKANGIECNEKTVRNLRNDLGLTKHYSPKKKTN